MTKNEMIDMMYGRGFTFNMESKSYGEPTGLHFLSEILYDRHDKNKVSVPAYGCTVYPETDEFEFFTLASNDNIKLSTPKYDDVQNKDHFDRLIIQFENSIIKQISVKSEDEITLTAEDLNFGNMEGCLTRE